VIHPLLWDARRAGGQALPYPFDRWLAAQIQRSIEAASVRVVLWDGQSLYRHQAAPIGDLVLHDRRTLLGLAVDPEYYFGEAYQSGRLSVRGPLEQVVESLSRLPAKTPGWLQSVMTRLALPNSMGGARRNVHAHYDLGNDFYKLWLDSEMLYTCAYFDRPEVSLEQAQRRKLDVICQKLGLRPGETVVEAGCGWGALALHMARRYGVRVKAFNISAEQLAHARERAAREGLADRVDFIDDDYRNVTGVCDAFVSIGMLEHVGTRHFGSLAAVLRRVVKRDGGRGLLHFIGRDTPRPLNAWIRRRIFPGAYPPTIAEVATQVLAPANLSVIDIENLRLHYERTLAHWSERFAANRDRVEARYGSEFTRAWELYLAGSQAAFASGWMQLFQIVFAPHESAPPWWRRPGLPPEAVDDSL
jgi:cyclopropane-fatty-acyl-phospholipid synthase